MSGDLENGLRAFQRLFQAALVRGMAKAGSRLLDDCRAEIPGVPLAPDGGTLRGSGTVHVDGELTEVAANIGGEPTPMTEGIQDRESMVEDAIVATVGFNTPYAAVMHEGGWLTGPLAGVRIQNWSEPDTGDKFLEKKLSANRDAYFDIVARELRRIA